MSETTYEIYPKTGFTVTSFLVSKNVSAALDFYARILGGTVVRDGTPSVVRLENTWVIVNEGGGPTDDKPTVHLAPPADPDRVSAFMELRVANIQECYELWRSRGATFLTEPKEHDFEWRCYMRDPDGHLIEVGEAKQSA